MSFIGYTPCQILSAYGFDKISIPNQQLHGYGTKIVIVIPYSYSNLQSDLENFCKIYNIPTPKLNIIKVKPNTVENNDWILESCIDTQWITAIAPGANISVVQAFSADINDLIDAVTLAESLNPDIISMSWGFPEFNGIQKNTIFNKKNIIYVAASGDNNIVEYPSSSPNVVAVSATNLYVNKDCTYNSEYTWQFSGSGFSKYFQISSYQLDNIPNIQSSFRSISDLCIQGGNDTGCVIYCSFQNGLTTGAGTSLSTPIIAGTFALITQLRNLKNKSKLGSATSNNKNCVQNIIYSTLKQPSIYNQIFNSVYDNTTNQKIDGYNTTCGLGSPNVPNFVKYLVDN